MIDQETAENLDKKKLRYPLRSFSKLQQLLNFPAIKVPYREQYWKVNIIIWV